MTGSRLLRNVLRAAVGVTISAVAVVIVVQAIDTEDVGRALGRAGWGTLLLVAALVILDIGARSMRWRALLLPLTSVSRREVTGHTFIGYLANSALPARLGEVVRSYTLGRRVGISKATVGGTIVVERMLDVASLALISLIALFLTPVGTMLVAGIGAVVAVCAIAAGVLLVATGQSARRRLASRIHARDVPARLRPAVAVLVKLVHGLSVVRYPRAMAEASAWSLAAWLLTGVSFAVAARSVGLELSVPQIALFVAATNLVTVIPAGPAYVGTFELAALTVATGIGAPAAASLAAVVLVHGVIVTATTLGGVIALAGMYLLPVVPAGQSAQVGAPESAD